MSVRGKASRQEGLQRIVAHLKAEVERRNFAEVKLRPEGSITIDDVRSALNADGYIVKRVADTTRYVAASMAAANGLGINLETTWEQDLAGC